MNKHLLMIKGLMALLLIFLVKIVSADGIVSISPASGDPGTTISATITLDSGASPSLPPANIDPSSVIIGSIEATSFDRTDETTVTVNFDIPAGMSPGYYDVEVIFDPPGVTYSLSNGFQVNGDIVVSTRTMGLYINDSISNFTGYTLFTPITYDVVYLINMNGEKVHSWDVSNSPALSVYLLENGHLVHTTSNSSSPFSGTGGAGGQINEYDWDGNLLWTYHYSSSTYCSHHDVEVLPNGNYLIIAWELKTEAEAIQAGRDTTTIPDGGLWPDHIIEVTPDYGTGSGGTIVWEWYAWDHLIQDFDATKDNYGIVEDHPELININYARTGMSGTYSEDWTHFNSIEYIEEYDQILLSVHSFSEIWIIDHSTTTAEAASHSGGDFGKGGDLLYRWGNPQTYDSGSSNDQELYSQHDATWIEDGYPGAGDILIFNNGPGRSGGTDYSSVDQITPPDNGSGVYSMSGSTYGPSSTTWQFVSDPVGDFYSMNISGAQRLPNGNTLICDGNYGTFCEVTSSLDTVWLYINPVDTDGPMNQGDEIEEASQGVGLLNQVFRCVRYDTAYAAFDGRDLSSQGFIEIGIVDPSASVIYVDGTMGNDSNTGTSWATAKETVAAAITEANYLGKSEIWVKTGTYYTTTGTDRSTSITLSDNMAIYGGFAGTEEATNERTNYGPGEANETIFSGDIGTQGANTDNTYRILITGADCVVDGITFTKAYGNGEYTERMGGAIYMADNASTVNNCHFEYNYAEAGGAIYVFNINGDGVSTYQTVAISNCTFKNNNANLGGAVVLRVGASTNMTDCTFENNEAEWRGGAVFIDYGAYESYPIIIDNSTFTSNNCNGNGGAIYVDDMASQLGGTYYTIQNCGFTSNTTTYRGGAICLYNTNNYTTVQDNTFTTNSAGLAGNAIAGDNGPSLTLNGNTFNTAQDIDLDEECSCTGTGCP